MPRSSSFSTPCRDSADRTHASQLASQLASQAQQDTGNTCSFSIGWPPQFSSRTGDPKDPCYIGRNFDAQRNTPALNQRPGGAEGFIPQGLRVKAGTRAWSLWRLLVTRGKPMKAGEIAAHLDIPTVQVFATAKRMILAEAVLTRKLATGGSEYRLGPTGVVEV